MALLSEMKTFCVYDAPNAEAIRRAAAPRLNQTYFSSL